MAAGELVPVARIEDIPPGKTLRVELEGREILLCHTGEGIFAVDNMCSHAAARLCEGRLKGVKLFCPMHGAAFDVRDGGALTRPARDPLPTFAVVVEGEEVLLCPRPR